LISKKLVRPLLQVKTRRRAKISHEKIGGGPAVNATVDDENCPEKKRKKRVSVSSEEKILSG